MVSSPAHHKRRRLGTLIETKLFDKRLKKVNKDYNAETEWNEYMRVAYTVEPVGQRCLRAIVLRMKFELGMSIALVTASVGLFFTRASWAVALGASGAMTALSAYLLWEARMSHEALAELRHELLKGINVLGEQAAKATPATAGTE